MSTKLFFSVIIPCLNEAAVIGRCLDAIARLNFSRQAFEVILVDNGSSDTTLEIASGFRERMDLIVLTKTDCHISALRNAGAAIAKGTYLAFLDADMLVSSDWLHSAFAIFSRSEVGVVGARHRIPENSSWVARAWFEERVAGQERAVTYLASGNLMLSKLHFDAVGGFDETLETNEDCDFCYRARAIGLSLNAFPEIAAVHLGTPQTIHNFYRNQRWHGTHVFRVFLRKPFAFKNIRALAFGFYELISAIGVLVGITASLLQVSHWVLALSLSGMLLVPFLLSLHICLVRLRSWRNFVPFVVLHLVYGLARALCLVDIRTWFGGHANGVPAKRLDRVQSAAKVGTSQ